MSDDPLVVHVPHIVDRAPILVQQDNKSAISFAHNPVSMAAMKGSLIRMSVVRDALEQGRILPQSVDTKDMCSDHATKATCPKDRERTMPQLMGQREWVSFQNEHMQAKPGVCKHCISSDLTHSRDGDTWVAVCNLCGTVTRG